MARPAALIALLVVLAAACGTGPHRALRPPSPSASASPAAQTIDVAPPTVRPLDVGSSGLPAPSGVTAKRAAPPVRIAIPEIGVDSPIEQLDLRPDGTIAVPSDPAHAGWYERGPVPGERGPAIILGHLDSTTGPGVFYRLSSLRRDDLVLINRTDGSQLRFRVQRLATFSVDGFPAADVYGSTPDPQLRLVTCGGIYSSARQRYLANVIVFAALAA